MFLSLSSFFGRGVIIFIHSPFLSFRGLGCVLFSFPVAQSLTLSWWTLFSFFGRGVIIFIHSPFLLISRLPSPHFLKIIYLFFGGVIFIHSPFLFTSRIFRILRPGCLQKIQRPLCFSNEFEILGSGAQIIIYFSYSGGV